MTARWLEIQAPSTRHRPNIGFTKIDRYGSRPLLLGDLVFGVPIFLRRLGDGTRVRESLCPITRPTLQSPVQDPNLSRSSFVERRDSVNLFAQLIIFLSRDQE